MAELLYPTVLDVVALHERVMVATGEAPTALRDEGALESALNRPHFAAAYQAAAIERQAVLLLTGVALAHPFIDGNKRTALATADTFLRVNGCRYGGDPIALADQIIAILTREGELRAAEEQLEDWLRQRIRSV